MLASAKAASTLIPRIPLLCTGLKDTHESQPALDAPQVDRMRSGYADGGRENDACDATPEIAGLQEKYGIGMVDWGDFRCIRNIRAALRQCQARMAHKRAAWTHSLNFVY
jgi:hypothetical protein